MNRTHFSYALAISGVATIAWLTSALLPWLGLASCALLFLLPVLAVAPRGGIGPSLIAALGGATAYNYFLLPPRFTLRIHEMDNLVSVIMLVAVALVTSRLAEALKAREAEAQLSARQSNETAELSKLLTLKDPAKALEAGREWMEQSYGPLRLIAPEALPEDDAAFTSLDLSAAAWATHNGDITGHGTRIMPAADWSFLPMTLAPHSGAALAALARPNTSMTREENGMAHLAQLALLLGQAWDRVNLETERRARERLEDAERLRRSMLASLAHDFRTPLTVLNGQLDALPYKSIEVEEARGAARRLARTMEDLLGIARLEGGALVPRMEPLDPVDVVAAAFAGVRVPADLSLKRTVSADLPFIHADPVLLQHVLVNLLDNALAHARSEVLLSVSQKRGAVQLEVSDDGPGIPEAEREQIFERFVRLEGSDRTSGSGLGLAIVQGFSEAMDMAIYVKASAQGGACFVLTMANSEGSKA